MPKHQNAVVIPPPLAIHTRCVALARKLDVCCLRTFRQKGSVAEGDWRVCINESVEPKIQSSKVSAICVEEAPKTLKQYDFIAVLGYANGLITLAGVDSSGEFHVISHNDKNTSRVLYVDVHVDRLADEQGQGCIHSFALLDGGIIVKFPWDSLAQTRVECGEGIVGIRASLEHRVIAQYGTDRMVLRALDTDSTLKTFDNVNTSLWGEGGCAWNPQKKLLVFGGATAVRYTSAPKWDVYQFGEGVAHAEPILSLQFAMFGEMVALLTASRDKIAIWDFDTETVLYSQAGTLFRTCALTELTDKEVSLLIFGDDSAEGQWEVTRLSLPVDDKMEVVGSKRMKSNANPSYKRTGDPANKRLRKMVDIEAEDAGDDEEPDLFDEIGATNLDTEIPDTPHSNTNDRSRNIDLLGMLDEETSITLMEGLERLKKRVAQLERKTSRRYALTPGACPPPKDESSQWLLYWDDIGQITKQGSGDGITLHIHLFSGPNAGYAQKHDRHNCHTAALSQRALVTGSEFTFEGGQHSVVTFYNLSTNEMWERRLKNETIAAVAVSDDFVAALGATSLYIFSIAGSVLGIYYLKGSPVGIAAKGNLLAVISEVSSMPKGPAAFSARLMWINGLRGLARNSINRIVDLYDDLLVLPQGKHIAWISISDQLNLWIADSGGQLVSLVPAMASFHKMGGVSLEWVPSLHLAELSSESKPDEQRERINVFPLYINEQKLCYIRLKAEETHPHNYAPVNFMGYTLRKAPLRIESASGAYMPFSMFNSILTRDPTLKEVSKTGLVEDVAGIPWQQYDEMRHSLTLQSAQIEMLMQLQQIYGFWFRDAERITQKAATSMGNVERVHDKWLLRMLRKVKGQRQDGNVAFDILRMIRYQRCLDTAADILSEQMDNRQRKVLQEASMLLANGPSRDFMLPQQETVVQQPDNRPLITPGVNEVTVMKRTVNKDNGQGKSSSESDGKAQSNTTKSDVAPANRVQGFTTMEDENKPADNWMQHVFKS